jgi:hypothetical protein
MHSREHRLFGLNPLVRGRSVDQEWLTYQGYDQAHCNDTHNPSNYKGRDKQNLFLHCSTSINVDFETDSSLTARR